MTDPKPLDKPMDLLRKTRQTREDAESEMSVVLAADALDVKGLDLFDLL